MSPPIDVSSVSPSAPVPQVNQAMERPAHKGAEQQSAAHSEVASAKEIHKENIKVDEKMLSLGFSVDHSDNVIKIRITNQNSGELVREFELKGLGQAHHEPRSKGLMVDNKT
jgi:flagellar hook assembly protein FlgD